MMNTYKAAVACLAMGLLAGCQKEKEATPTYPTLDPGKPKINYVTWYFYERDEPHIDGNQHKVDCLTMMSGNCLPEVVCKPGIASAVEDVWNAIGTAQPEAIASAFSRNQETLSTFLLPSDISGAIAGTINVTRSQNPPDMRHARFLVFRDKATNKVITACPLVYE